MIASLDFFPHLSIDDCQTVYWSLSLDVYYTHYNNTWSNVHFDMIHNHPASIFCIIATEFCERFSFCGLRSKYGICICNGYVKFPVCWLLNKRPVGLYIFSHKYIQINFPWEFVHGFCLLAGEIIFYENAMNTTFQSSPNKISSVKIYASILVIHECRFLKLL